MKTYIINKYEIINGENKFVKTINKFYNEESAKCVIDILSRFHKDYIYLIE